jgi:hypothetical protein
MRTSPLYVPSQGGNAKIIFLNKLTSATATTMPAYIQNNSTLVLLVVCRQEK